MDNVLNRVRPTTVLDKAALIHDIEYTKPNNQREADNNMYANIKKASLLTGIIINPLLFKIFLVKNLIGYETKTDIDLYKYLKTRAKLTFKLYPMQFADDRYI